MWFLSTWKTKTLFHYHYFQTNPTCFSRSNISTYSQHWSDDFPTLSARNSENRIHKKYTPHIALISLSTHVVHAVINLGWVGRGTILLLPCQPDHPVRVFHLAIMHQFIMCCHLHNFCLFYTSSFFFVRCSSIQKTHIPNRGRSCTNMCHIKSRIRFFRISLSLSSVMSNSAEQRSFLATLWVSRPRGARTGAPSICLPM